ncbi:MerR family transcriptional regulator [Nonomuraea sp. NPDC050663]|uniref:MerR family transcriptional regulator n=1 Tax=Nonomuraea sp. NPDC050663 TaxID=3364370 RepID=UPI003799058D
MRIGELAALAGVTTRAVRHYHQLGLLPEPRRRANGYRVYGLRDAVELARIRRLTELGLSLEEVRDVLADDYGRELREVLGELDADLARQEADLARRRERLAALMAQQDLHPDDPVSPEMAALFTRIPAQAQGLLAKERQWLAMLDTAASPQVKDEIVTMLGPMADDPAFVQRVADVYAAMDEVSDPGDPRVPQVARELLALFPAGVLPGDGQEMLDSPFGAAFLADLTPGQAAIVRHAFQLLGERDTR